jgi:hypothetical protein
VSRVFPFSFIGFRLVFLLNNPSSAVFAQSGNELKVFQKAFVYSDRRGRRSLQFCKNTPFEHDVKPYIIGLKVFGSTFFSKTKEHQIL